MPAVPTRDLKIGKIIDKTFGVLEHNLVPGAIYLVAIAALNVISNWFSQDLVSLSLRAGIGLVVFVIGISAAYMLLDAMLKNTGLRTRGDDDVFLGYIGLTILYTLGVGLGFILLVIPGLLVMARWSIAQPMQVGSGAGVMKSLGESWERTRGNEFAIIVAALALILVPVAVMIASAILLDATSLVGIAVTQLATAAMTVISLSMGVALYGLIVGSGKDVAPTFE